MNSSAAEFRRTCNDIWTDSKNTIMTNTTGDSLYFNEPRNYKLTHKRYWL